MTRKKQKVIVGLVEEVSVAGKETVKTLAVFDTGARITSVDTRLASKAKLGPIIKTQRVRNPSFKQHTRRPIVMAKVKIKGRVFDIEVNIQDRSHMTFPMIIGRNIMLGNFIVDPEKNKHLFKEMKEIKIKKELKNQSRIRHFIEK